jgi:hypothetical protein
MKNENETIERLGLIAQFMANHGRDEGGYSDETRQQFKDDAAFLRKLALRIADACETVPYHFTDGERVMATPHAYESGLFPEKRQPVMGTVAGIARSPLSVRVRLDGQKRVGKYHVAFWAPAGDTKWASDDLI